MTELLIASVQRQQTRFLRSTDLVRDFDDPKSLNNYWLTDFGRACLSQIADGFRPESGRRAWRLTGDFGSGKSSFALLLARSVRDFGRLPQGLRSVVTKAFPQARSANFLPILVAGNREPISNAVTRALYSTLSKFSPYSLRTGVLATMETALNRRKVSDQKAIEFLVEANSKLIQSKKADGILLILDEVGKFLEFAAMEPDQQDVFFLQQLAETACRSGEQPINVVCLLHQSINAYAEQLAKVSQQEWDKIAGRFEEITFSLPLDQVAQLAAAALGTNTQKLPASTCRQACEVMEKAIQIGWFGTSASRATLRQLSERLFPIDPMVIPVLVRIFRRFGQNERSLFGFLCSYEPFGLWAFSQRPLTGNTRPYQLADLYDYVRANLGHRLSSATYKAHWNVIESTIEAFQSDEELEVRTLKTVGLLNLVNADDLLPIEEAIVWAVAGNSVSVQKDVRIALKRISGTPALFFRGKSRGYSIWPHTSVDLDARLEEAKRAVISAGSIAEAISDQLPSQPIVARAHYINTGNLRYFDVVYCQPGELEKMSAAYSSKADGFILIPLCETASQSKTCEKIAASLPLRADIIRIIAVPKPLAHLNQAVLDAQRWAWVQLNTPELNNDPIARDEVALYLQESRQRLKSQVQSYLGLNRHVGESTLKWFFVDHEGQSPPQTFTARRLLETLSYLCDVTFDQAPRIKNELVNRHCLSSAAAAARMRLIDLMFTSSDKEDLGMEKDRKPPEKSMYLSVLRNTGLHREREGVWALGLPSKKIDEKCRVTPVLRRIKAILSAKPDCRIAVTDLLQDLRRPPYGVRDGLFPIFLAIIAVEGEHEIAFYENGTFLRDVGRDAFLRMTKVPEKFEIQLCRIEGVRSSLFQKLAEVLELPSSEQQPELLDVVRNLCVFVAQLPEYVRQTKKLNPVTLAVRDVILDAREPVRMVFHDLPVACGYEEFEVGKPVSLEVAVQFVGILKNTLDELRSAFPTLLFRMASCIAEVFGYKGAPLAKFRGKLANRAEHLLVRVTENKLKAFAFRIFDEARPEADWLNSVGSVLALRPPDKWKDEDEDTFLRELDNAAGRFKRAESAAFGASDATGKTAFRVAITRPDGIEKQEVVQIDTDEETRLEDIRKQISTLIEQNDRLGLAAASKAIWHFLKEPKEDE